MTLDAKRLVHSRRVLSDSSLFLMTDMACLRETVVNRLTTSWEFMISSSRTHMLFRSLQKATVFFTRNLVLPMSGLGGQRWLWRYCNPSIQCSLWWDVEAPHPYGSWESHTNVVPCPTWSTDDSTNLVWSYPPSLTGSPATGCLHQLVDHCATCWRKTAVIMTTVDSWNIFA